MDIFLPICALGAASLGLLWFFVPILSGIPWVPTDNHRIQKALALVHLKAGEKIYDLGCGDGRVLIMAAQKFNARAVGIEISLLHVLVARVRIRIADVKKNCTARWGNFYRANLRDADVIYQYGHSRYAGKLKKLLEGQLRVGARVVSINVDIPGWQPEAINWEELIFVYRMPPPSGDVASFMMQRMEQDGKIRSSTEPRQSPLDHPSQGTDERAGIPPSRPSLICIFGLDT